MTEHRNNRNRTQPIPKWLMQRYSVLYSLCGKKEFDYSQALFALKGTNLTSMVLSHLNRRGWLELRLDPRDSRRRIYKMKPPESAIHDIALNGRKEVETREV